MPTAKAPTLGRKRSSVLMATRKPPPTSPTTSSGPTGTPSKVSVPTGWGASISSGSPPRPGRSPGTRKAVTPAARGPGPVRAKTVQRSASGALEIQHFSPWRRQPAPAGSARSASAAASEPAPGSLSAKAATARPEATSGSQRARCAALPERRTGWPPRPWRARAVSASVHSRASDSRSRHRSVARTGPSAGNTLLSRPSSPRAARRGRLTRPGAPASARGRSRRAASSRSSSHHVRCSSSSVNGVAIRSPPFSRFSRVIYRALLTAVTNSLR